MAEAVEGARDRSLLTPVGCFELKTRNLERLLFIIFWFPDSPCRFTDSPPGQLFGFPILLIDLPVSRVTFLTFDWV